MQTNDLALLSLLADIRKAAGDEEGRLMQDELVAHIAALRVNAERYLWVRSPESNLDTLFSERSSGSTEMYSNEELDTAIDAAMAAK